MTPTQRPMSAESQGTLVTLVSEQEVKPKRRLKTQKVTKKVEDNEKVILFFCFVFHQNSTQTKNKMTFSLSSTFLVTFCVFNLFLVFTSCSETRVTKVPCDSALIGRWVGAIPTLNTLVIHADATLDGTLLGLVIHGFVTTDVSVSPLWLDLHLNVGVVVPCIYSIGPGVNGLNVLTLALDLNLVDILAGTCVRPTAFLSTNILKLTANVNANLHL